MKKIFTLLFLSIVTVSTNGQIKVIKQTANQKDHNQKENIDVLIDYSNINFMTNVSTPVEIFARSNESPYDFVLQFVKDENWTSNYNNGQIYVDRNIIRLYFPLSQLDNLLRYLDKGMCKLEFNYKRLEGRITVENSPQ